VQSFTEPFAPLSDLERRRSCEDTLAAAPEGLAELWLFGYGSLMWDAPFSHGLAKTATLSGWRREMSIWTALARGTPECPGLSLGLVPGGACEGMGFQIAVPDRAEALEIIWRREMWTDVYRPTWVSLEIEGRSQPAFTFTTNPASRQFAGDLSPDDAVAYIAQATGERGPCRDYLGNTVARLKALGIDEPHLYALDEAVKATTD
jgi:cation transport protein ChaC